MHVTNSRPVLPGCQPSTSKHHLLASSALSVNDAQRTSCCRLEAGSSATPEEAAKWRAALVRALVRRGQARVGLGRPAEALADYEEAAK